MCAEWCLGCSGPLPMNQWCVRTIEHQQSGKLNMANQGFCTDGATHACRDLDDVWVIQPCVYVRVLVHALLASASRNAQPEHTEIRALLFTHCAPLSSNLFSCAPLPLINRKHTRTSYQKKNSCSIFIWGARTRLGFECICWNRFIPVTTSLGWRIVLAGHGGRRKWEGLGTLAEPFCIQNKSQLIHFTIRKSP